MTTIAHPLSWILVWPTLAMVALMFVPAHRESWISRISLAGVIVPFLLAVSVFCNYDRLLGGFQYVDKLAWVEAFGISYHVGIDGINGTLVLLLGICSVAAMLVAGSVRQRVKEYYILLLLIIIGTYGAFLSLDIFFFYFFHEVAAVPAFLLIAGWGSGRKDYGAMKLMLYLAAGAALALVALLALYNALGLGTFDFVQIREHVATHPLPLSLQNILFPLIVIGFGVTVALWPFYTWAPVGYATAPTSVSMLHAGVLKKMGAYAILRFAIELMPQAAQIWMPLIAVLAVVNIVYCGLVALTQRDLKYVLGYSSCSHMGYIFLGLACVNTVGLNGVVFLMFAHGVMAALGFALVGFCYDRTRTTNVEELGGLAKRMPFIGTAFAMMAMASAGVPGFANFVAEVMVLLGAWDQYRWATVLAVLGIVITAVYMLKMIRLVFQGPLNVQWAKIEDAKTPVQRLPYWLLLTALLAVGIWPALILKNIESGVKSILHNSQQLTY